MDELVAYTFNLSTFFDVPDGPVIVAEDPDDDIFLRCAEVAQAIYVVSGDQHLLRLKNYASIPIVTVHEFLAEVFPSELE